MRNRSGRIEEAEREDKLRREEAKLRREEVEREERKADRELRRKEAEQRRWEVDREERQRKELVEDERRQTEMQQQAELFAQRQRELDRQTARDRVEEARRDSAVLKGKLFGDAMRASVIRMGWTLSRPFHFKQTFDGVSPTVRSHARSSVTVFVTS